MIVIVEPSLALPLVAMSVTFRAGSAYDPPGKEGLARLVARMLRRGTTRLRATEVEDAVDLLGGEFGTEVSCGASFVGSEVIARNVDPFVALAAELLGDPAFDAGELAKLVREALAEIVEARDNDRGLASRALRRTMYAGHPYARRTSGYTTTLGAITRDDVVAFYRRHYVRANAVVCVSGLVTEAEGHALAERLLARIPEGVASPDLVPETPAPSGRTLVFVDKPERSQTQLYVGARGTHARDDDHLALHVANTIFGGTFTARLMREVRSKRGWSYGASSRLGLDRRREAFTMWTAPAAADAAPCLALELELLVAWRDGGVTEDELTFTKSYLARSHVFDIDTASKRAQQKVEAVLLDLPPGYHEGYVAGVKAVTKDEADAAVRRRIAPDDLVIAVVGTHADVGAAIEAAVPGLARAEVVPYDLE